MFTRSLFVQFSIGLLICLSAGATNAGATNLVTGNGFGFAVVPPKTATVSAFYAHPYSFARPDPKNPLGEGLKTTNFLKSLGWSDPAAHSASAEYEQDSHVINARSSAGEGFFFMPFGLRRTALVSVGPPLPQRRRPAVGRWNGISRSACTGWCGWPAPKSSCSSSRALRNRCC